MVYVRGHRTDYDTWSGTYGCAGWSYAELLPYFRRAEDQQRGESVYHGVGGPLGKAAIDPAYLADQADLDVLVAGVRQAREVAACQPFVGLTAGELAPGDRPRDDRGLWPWVRATSPRSSTRQAAAPWGASDAAVCDPALRVHGDTLLTPAELPAEPATVSSP
jgi:choline dehydrogenase-like flavoprotein